MSLKHRIATFQIPFPLPYQGNWLRGWNLMKMRHPHEPETVAFFRQRIKSSDRVADVGAHVGYYTSVFRKLAREVHAFEPEAKNFRYLSWVRGPKVVLHNEAVGAREDTASLYGKQGSGGNSLAYKFGPALSEVPVIPLKKYGHFDWIKIDVEGYELAVLDGMEQTHCTVEYSPKNLRQVGIEPEVFLTEILNRGYEIYRIVAGGVITPVATATDLQDVKGHCNLYLKPSTKTD